MKYGGQKLGFTVDGKSSPADTNGLRTFLHTQVKARIQRGNLSFRFHQDHLCGQAESFGNWCGITQKTFGGKELDLMRKELTILIELQLTRAEANSSDTVGKDCHQMRVDTLSPSSGSMSHPYTYTDDD